MSKPSRHLYADYRSLPTIKQGHGLSVLSTSKGIMTDPRHKSRRSAGNIFLRSGNYFNHMCRLIKKPIAITAGATLAQSGDVLTIRARRGNSKITDSAWRDAQAGR